MSVFLFQAEGKGRSELGVPGRRKRNKAKLTCRFCLEAVKKKTRLGPLNHPTRQRKSRTYQSEQKVEICVGSCGEDDNVHDLYGGKAIHV